MTTPMSTAVYFNPERSVYNYVASTRLNDLSKDTKGRDFIDELDEREANAEFRTSQISYGIIIHNRMPVTDYNTGGHPHVFAIMPITDDMLQNERVKAHIRHKINGHQFARLVEDDSGHVTRIYLPKKDNDVKPRNNVSEDLPLAAIAICYFSNRKDCEPQVEHQSRRPSRFDMDRVDARMSYYSKAMFEQDLAHLNEMVPFKKKKLGQKVVDGAVDNCLVS